MRTTTRDSLVGLNAGPYKLQTKLDAGSVSATYMAEHAFTGTQVAVEVLHTELSNEAEMTQRFFGLVAALGKVRHPSIADIIDFGLLPHDGQAFPYAVMQLLDGVSLAELLRREAPLLPDRAFGIA